MPSGYPVDCRLDTSPQPLLAVSVGVRPRSTRAEATPNLARYRSADIGKIDSCTDTLRKAESVAFTDIRSSA